MHRLSIFLLLLVATVIVGCTAEKRSYSIAAKNRLSDPVTVWVCKDGPPYEADWLTPEQFGLSGRLDEEPNLGFVIPPGKIVDSPNLEGSFEPETRVWMRVYAGDLKLSQMLATNRGSLTRQDVLLRPGHNAIIIDSYGGVLRVNRVDRSDAQLAK